MTIYTITYNPRTNVAYTFMTASAEVAKYSKDFAKKNYGVKEIEVLEYEVKTQGKNFNDIALPKKSKI